jgi:predicted carbohydrate-binding protein with CBM5 and CBM33 domain
MTMRVVPLLLVALFVAGVNGHGWLSFPESRNSRLNQVAPTGSPGLQYNRMNGNGRAAYLPESLNPVVMNQPGENDNLSVKQAGTQIQRVATHLRSIHSYHRIM